MSLRGQCSSARSSLPLIGWLLAIGIFPVEEIASRTVLTHGVRKDSQRHFQLGTFRTNNPSGGVGMFEFTDNDLNYNKNRQLSPKQKQWLNSMAGYTRKYSWRTAIFMTVFTIFGLCLILAMFLANERSRAALFSSPINLVILIAVIPLVMIILGVAIFVNYRNANKLENAVVSSASGPVRFDTSYSSESGMTSYYVFVGDKRFTFGDDMSNVFQEGEKYNFYYCKAGMYEMVMSYEKLNM